jgi:hypothetical protein
VRFYDNSDQIKFLFWSYISERDFEETRANIERYDYIALVFVCIVERTKKERFVDTAGIVFPISKTKYI